MKNKKKCIFIIFYPFFFFFTLTKNVYGVNAFHNSWGSWFCSFLIDFGGKRRPYFFFFGFLVINIKWNNNNFMSLIFIIFFYRKLKKLQVTKQNKTILLPISTNFLFQNNKNCIFIIFYLVFYFYIDSKKYTWLTGFTVLEEEAGLVPSWLTCRKLWCKRETKFFLICFIVV